MTTPTHPPRIAWLINLFGDPDAQHRHAAAVLRATAAQLGAEIVPVYCLASDEDALEEVPRADRPEYVRARLSALLGEHDLPAGTPIVVELDDGPSLRDKAEAVSAALRDEEILLTVVHTHAYSAVDRFFIGSFSEKFFTLSRTPVMVLNPHVSNPDHYDRITFASDLSERSMEAFHRFLPIAAGLDASVRIEQQMPVRELGVFMLGDASREQYRQELEAARARAAEKARPLLVAAEAAGVQATFSTHDESASEPTGQGFEDRAREADTPIIAISAHGKHKRPGNIGSTALWLMRHAQRPVLVMPPPLDG